MKIKNKKMIWLAPSSCPKDFLFSPYLSVKDIETFLLGFGQYICSIDSIVPTLVIVLRGENTVVFFLVK
jgi:hypothetical protein